MMLHSGWHGALVAAEPLAHKPKPQGLLIFNRNRHTVMSHQLQHCSTVRAYHVDGR